MLRSQGSPQNLCYAGTFFLLLGVVYTCIGKVWTKVRWVLRVDEPGRYWFEIAVIYLCGVFLIGLYLLSGQDR